MIDENLKDEIFELKLLNFMILDKSKVATISETNYNTLEDFLNTLIYDYKFCVPVYVNNAVHKIFGKIEDKIFECIRDVKKLKDNPNYDDIIRHFDAIKFIAESKF